MKNMTFQDLYTLLYKNLSNPLWLEKIGITKTFIDAHCKDPYFTIGIKFILKEQDFTCKKVLELCLQMIEDLTPPTCTTKISLLYLYEYALNKSFPDAVSIPLQPSLASPCELYLKVLHVICEYEKKSEGATWQSKYPMNFLTKEEENALEYPEEYKKFYKAFTQNYTYEMMKLNGEVLHFNTLDHICGVHYLALYIGRQLKALGLPIDLGRVSGAAAGHDIGKYGCKGSELKRVPYLHYYYSDQWFKKYDIHYIRHIAINHSTWDLELENLSLESLILIYADFRVKNKKINQSFEMCIFSLRESFDVILNKLDNVDEKKEKRYKRVYAKLKDFEDFLLHLGVNTFVDQKIPLKVEKEQNPNYALLQGNKIIENLKYVAIQYNISLMHELRDEYSLDALLELARSEKNWKKLREYIRIFQEYSTYLTQKQKLQTMGFLFDNLVHPEDDIRRHCAELMGILIALFDEAYRKETPEKVEIQVPQINGLSLFKEYLNALISPSHKIIPIHRFWLGYTIKILVDSVFTHIPASLRSSFREALLQQYEQNIKYKNTDTQLFLLETIKYIPLTEKDPNFHVLYDYIFHMLKKRNTILRLSALEASNKLISKLPENSTFTVDLKNYFESISLTRKKPAENTLLLKVARTLCLEKMEHTLEVYCKLDEGKIEEVFLNNLKSATDWVQKKNQINFLLNYTLKCEKAVALHTAIHFCNLLKVSDIESVRNKAGAAILKLMPILNFSERNEVAVELLRALEIEEHRFTEYIPYYLGQIILFLDSKELNEVIEDLSEKVKHATLQIKSLILKTIGLAIANYPSSAIGLNEKFTKDHPSLIKMLGILFNGLADYNLSVKQAAFSVLGKEVFGAKTLNLEQKEVIFNLAAKKILTLLTDTKNEELLFLTNSVGLNHLYRFISDYTFFKGNLQLSLPSKVAFFPGSFDPFSLSHKEIAKSIRDLGFEVYLAIDEFSWSKQTLPNALRRNILTMSIADELHMYIYPDNFPTNIANPRDLQILRENFAFSDPYIVVGGDVIVNASSYKNPPVEHSIHHFNHIIFERGKTKELLEASENILGEVQWLTLPSKYTDISSTQIRNYIDDNRDISYLVDPLTQQYIYENGFYQRAPLDKSLIKSLWLKIDIVEAFSENLIEEICVALKHCKKNFHTYLKELSQKPSGRLIIIRDNKTHELLAFSAFHWVRSSMLYGELKDATLSEYIRENSLGRISLLDGMFVKQSEKYPMLEQILLTETVAFCIARDYEYAIFKSMVPELTSASICELLQLHGFTALRSSKMDEIVYVVNMSNPCILNLDLNTIIKEPFRSHPKIRQVIGATRKKLQGALTKLYPGELILSFDNNILHQSIIRKICEENKVPTEARTTKKLGSAMCVPYGDILDRYVIPNTVTKSLHTEKFFNANMQGFKIGAFPHYLTLENQVKMLKSFNRPVLLVDNILHKGYRMQALDPLFKKEEIKVQKIIIGILSGQGKELMEVQNREVDSVYFIPRLKIWFNENALYPFIGGDALWRGRSTDRNLLPSINLILPYTSPTYINNSSIATVYSFSKTCIENAIEILEALEQEYHLLHARNLTLSSLGEVFTIPRCPDHGENMDFDLNIHPSYYLKNDLELLSRLHYSIVEYK